MGKIRDFNEKVVFITGAGGGLGRAFAKYFALAGAKLALADLDASALAGLCEELKRAGAESIALELDVSDEAACQKAVAATVEHFGQLDVLINNAGITCRCAFDDTQSATFRKVMDVNLFGAMYCTAAALPHIKAGRGVIIAISSIAGISPVLGRSAYSASKHALHGLFDTLRTELFEHGVGVTIVCPGFTATGIGTNALDGDGSRTKHPQSTVGKAATPDSVAASVFRAASRDQRLLVLSSVGRMTHLMMKFCPGLYERLMARKLSCELER